MLEALVAVTATTSLFALARGIRGNHRYRVDPRLVVPRDERGDDLPCPWCHGPTYEDDTRCRNCGRNFG